MMHALRARVASVPKWTVILTAPIGFFCGGALLPYAHELGLPQPGEGVVGTATRLMLQAAVASPVTALVLVGVVRWTGGDGRDSAGA